MKIKFILFILVTQILFAKNDSLRSDYGISLFYNNNVHQAEFAKLPYCPSCSKGYKEGFGNNFSFGAFYDYALTDRLNLRLKANYYSFGTNLTSNEYITIILNNKLSTGQIEHSIDANIASLGLEPFLSYNIFKDLNINLGLHLGKLIKNSYSQQEKIIIPSNGGTFIDSLGIDTKSRIRNQFSGELLNPPTIYFAPIFSVSYNFSLNTDKTLIIQPEANFIYGLSQIDNHNSIKYWNAYSASFGVNLIYSPQKPKEIIKKYEFHQYIDTVKVIVHKKMEPKTIKGIEFKKSEIEENDNIILTKETLTRTDTLIYYVEPIRKLSSELVAKAVNGETEEDLKDIVINEILSINLKPLLNYIFFEKNSSDFQNSYIRFNSKDNRSFNENILHNYTALETYYHILNIIGNRMNLNPKAKITLIGCNDGLDEEKNNKELSNKRANTVKNYLVDIWEIDPTRISIEVRNNPEKASTPLIEPDKSAENRRVEIISDDYEITKPIYTRSSYWEIKPEKIVFNTDIVAEAGIIKATLNLSNNNLNFIQYDLTEGKQTSEWFLEDIIDTILKFDNFIQCDLFLKDSLEKEKNITGRKINIIKETIQKKSKEKIADKTKEKYSLILFDFNKATLSSSNNQIVELIKSNIKPESNITINGYADRTGDANHNKTLSEKRALAVEKLINHKNAKSFGIGSEKLLYDNNSPEGRFYSRTVEIEIETPIEY